MKVMFECDNGAYVVEIHEKRLYARVEPDTDVPAYGSTAAPLLSQGHFHEYREDNQMLQNKMEKIIAADLKKAMK